MRHGKNEYITAFASAWEELFDFRLPRPVGGTGETPANRLTAPAFVWCGAITGAVIAALATITKMVFNLHLASLFFTTATFLLLSCKDSGRCDHLARKHVTRFLNRNSSGGTSGNHAVGTLLLILRFLLLLILGYSGAFWYLPLLLAGAFSIQAFLAISSDTPCPLLPDGFRTRSNLTAALLLITMIALCFSALLTLAAIAACALVYTRESSRCRHKGFYAENISFSGYIAEWALLIAAVAFL